MIVVDDFACSKCVRDIIEGVNSSGSKMIGLICSEGYTKIALPLLKRTDVKVITEQTVQIQSCFPTINSLAIFTWKNDRYVLWADISVGESDMYKEELINLK